MTFIRFASDSKMKDPPSFEREGMLYMQNICQGWKVYRLPLDKSRLGRGGLKVWREGLKASVAAPAKDDKFH